LAAAASAPPVNVTLVTARKRDLPVQLEGTGTVAPTLTVDVRPQTTSMIRQVHVREGQFVRAGQPLFTLDAAAEEANVARLNAQLARDQAALADAQRQMQRSRELLAQNFVSQGALDSAQTLVDTQTAAVAASRAAVTAGRVPLSYARIVAPNGGRVGAVTVFKGSAVQANVTSLVTITQLDPIDVAFTVPQRYLADVLKASQGEGAPVNATLGEGGAPVTGNLVFVDNAIDPASGSVKVKARFANPESRLWPGAFVRTALTVRAIKDAIVIPQGAIIQSPRGTIVYVFAEGKAALRQVQVLVAEGEDVAVSGLRPGERIVLDGRQNVRPGSTLIERQREGGGRPGGASGAGRGGRPGGASGPGGGGGPGGAAGPGGPAGPSTGANTTTESVSSPERALRASGAGRGKPQP
jgi:RND family efflux transporter MFP subunit